MSTYNLTEDQKTLLRTLVKHVRAGELDNEFIVHSRQDAKRYDGFICSIGLNSGGSIEFAAISDLEALCIQDPLLVHCRWNNQGTNKIYSILQAGFDAVDNDFEVQALATGAQSAAGDIFHMSGDFRGAFLNIKSTLTNVSQTIAAMPDADQPLLGELQELVEQLNEALQQIPPENAEEAEAVAESAKVLVEAATKDKPNKTMVEISAEGLKKAAENIASVLPIVLTIATEIVATVAKLTASP